MKKLLIVTGGSGGHVIPSISLFEHLNKNFNIKIVSDLRGSKFIDETKYSYKLIDVPNLFLKPYLLPLNIFKYIINIIKSYQFLQKENINIIISTGGYMSLPFCIAAYLLKKKIFLFEPNSVLGRTNKIVLKISSKILCYDKNLRNFPKQYEKKKSIIHPILKGNIYKLKKNSNILDKKKKILVIGGSQGASFFDNKISDLIVQISKLHEVEIIQQISNEKSISLIKKKYDKKQISYKFFKFTNESEKIYEDIDIAITRGGASTLSELSYLNIPFIAVPLPTAKDNHQYYNSKYYYDKNVCWIINQDKFDIEKISDLISGIFKNNNDYIKKVDHLKALNEKINWNDTNNRIIEIINEN